MNLLIKQYFYIAFLMGKPQDLPGGSQQMQFGVALSFLTYVLALGAVHELERAMLYAVVDLIGSALFFYVALQLVGRPERFAQAFGGLCGAGAFVNLAAVPIYLARSPASAGTPSGLSLFAEFVLLVWSLSLLSHVLRHTFEIGKLASTLVAFAYIIVLITLMDWLFPADPELIDPLALGPGV